MLSESSAGSQQLPDPFSISILSPIAVLSPNAAAMDTGTPKLTETAVAFDMPPAVSFPASASGRAPLLDAGSSCTMQFENEPNSGRSANGSEMVASVFSPLAASQSWSSTHTSMSLPSPQLPTPASPGPNAVPTSSATAPPPAGQHTMDAVEMEAKLEREQIMVKIRANWVWTVFWETINEAQRHGLGLEDAAVDIEKLKREQELLTSYVMRPHPFDQLLLAHGVLPSQQPENLAELRAKHNSYLEVHRRLTERHAELTQSLNQLLDESRNVRPFIPGEEQVHMLALADTFFHLKRQLDFSYFPGLIPPAVPPSLASAFRPAGSMVEGLPVRRPTEVGFGAGSGWATFPVEGPRSPRIGAFGPSLRRTVSSPLLSSAGSSVVGSAPHSPTSAVSSLSSMSLASPLPDQLVGLRKVVTRSTRVKTEPGLEKDSKGHARAASDDDIEPEKPRKRRNSDGEKKKKGGKRNDQRTLPKEAVAEMKAWLSAHWSHPYPSDAEKHQLAKQTGLKVAQVNYWFINARVRIWRPALEKADGKDKGESKSGFSCSELAPPAAAAGLRSSRHKNIAKRR